MIFAGICRAIIFSKIVMASYLYPQPRPPKAFASRRRGRERRILDEPALAQGTIKQRYTPITGEFFAHKADNFLAQRVAGACPCFHAAKMFYARLDRAKLQIVHAGFNKRVNPLFQKIKKRELV